MWRRDINRQKKKERERENDPDNIGKLLRQPFQGQFVSMKLTQRFGCSMYNLSSRTLTLISHLIFFKIEKLIIETKAH